MIRKAKLSDAKKNVYINVTCWKKAYKHVLISTLKENSANIFYKKIGGKKIGECNFVLQRKTYLENVYVYDL